MSSTDTQNTGQSPLQSELGTTTIQDAVVTAIIGMAAEEVDGVATSHGGVRLPGDTSPTVGEFVDNITGGSSRTRGLSVDVGERQTAADLTINVEYGRSIPKVTEAVRKRVIERVENLTGLEVTEVNIQVNDVDLPES
ncbi:MAG TPA: Asp23/Gls24 family envelope stress response protein [Rubrobacter sp.]